MCARSVAAWVHGMRQGVRGIIAECGGHLQSAWDRRAKLEGIRGGITNGLVSGGCGVRNDLNSEEGPVGGFWKKYKRLAAGQGGVKVDRIQPLPNFILLVNIVEILPNTFIRDRPTG